MFNQVNSLVYCGPSCDKFSIPTKYKTIISNGLFAKIQRVSNSQSLRSQIMEIPYYKNGTTNWFLEYIDQPVTVAKDFTFVLLIIACFAFYRCYRWWFRPFRQVLRHQSQKEHKDENMDQDRDTIVTEFSYINEIIWKSSLQKNLMHSQIKYWCTYWTYTFRTNHNPRIIEFQLLRHFHRVLKSMLDIDFE